MSNLHVDSVQKSYKTKQILTDVFISCQKGEIIGLLGRNGTGKSTLLEIIFGSTYTERRFVKIGEKISKGLFDNRKQISYLPQDSFLPNHVKINTIIDLFCDKKKAELLKKHHIINPLLNKKIKQVSGGEKRLLETFLIIYSETLYALIDEPFNGVAPIYKEEIKDKIKEQSIDKGFIITDHDYKNILDIATRIIIIHDGGTKEIKNKKELIDLGYIPETAF